MALTWQMFLHELWVAFRITATVLCIIFAGYFWNKRRKIDYRDARMVLLGQGLFVFCFGLTRALFVVADFFSKEFSEELVIVVDDTLFFLFWKIATFVGIFGIICLLLTIERFLVKSRYVFTAIASIGLIIAMASPDVDFSRWTTYITLPISMIGLIFLYFYLFYKGSGMVRKRAGVSIIGLFLLGAGTLLGTTAGRGTLELLFGEFPAFVPVIILTLGLAIYTYINVKD